MIQAALQLGHLLLESSATCAVRGREADFRAFGRSIKGLLRRLDEQPSAMDLLEIGTDAVEAQELHAQRTNEYLREQNEQRQTIVAMLTNTLAEVSGQADASVARLQTIEQQMERVTGLDDMRMLSTNLEACLTSLREAAAQQRRGSSETIQHLREQITVAQKHVVPQRTQPPLSLDDIELEDELADDFTATTETAYVAAFKLQRADHISGRYGESAKMQMLSLISQSLKAVLSPNDRLIRWKGTSFVMFISSTGTLSEVRTRLRKAVSSVGQHYIEVGKKSALLSIGIDWTVFLQSKCPSIDAVFSEVDAFLATESPANGAPLRKEDN